MYRIIDKKSNGKSSRLMLLAKENNGIFVCSNPIKMKEKAYSYGIVGIDFISYDQYLLDWNNDTLIEDRPYYIDEIEELFHSEFLPLAGYTLSIED